MAAAGELWLGEKSIAINIYSELSTHRGVHMKLLCISPQWLPQAPLGWTSSLVLLLCPPQSSLSLLCGSQQQLGPHLNCGQLSWIFTSASLASPLPWGKINALFPLGEAGTIFPWTLNSPLCLSLLLRCLVMEGKGVCVWRRGGGVSLWTQESVSSWMSLSDDYSGFKNVSFSALGCFLSLRSLEPSDLHHALQWHQEYFTSPTLKIN